MSGRCEEKFSAAVVCSFLDTEILVIILTGILSLMHVAFTCVWRFAFSAVVIMVCMLLLTFHKGTYDAVLTTCVHPPFCLYVCEKKKKIIALRTQVIISARKVASYCL